MTVFALAGPVTTALTHFALYGLSAIVENETGKSVRLWWTDESNPRPQLDAGLDPDEIAAAVHRHAARGASPHSWLCARVDYGHNQTAVFSPRIATPSTPSAWRQLQLARHRGIDAAAGGGELDLRLIGALGEPAYWPTGRNADAGASRWEMKTRNRGEEFVGGRLLLVGQHVAARTPDRILSGLTGPTVDDEAGGNKPESRSGTGFTRPGPVDNALAWCALWGISQFPIAHHNGTPSGTAGVYVPERRSHPAFVFLPVPTQPVTLSRLRTLLASRQLAIAATSTDTADPLDVIAADAARKWLNQRAVRALMKFPVHVSDNKSAPERQVLDGSVVALTNSSSLWT